MKNIFLFAVVALLAVSCSTTICTSKVATAPVSLLSATVADLDVAAERVSYTLNPSKSLCRGGLENVKQAAEQELLVKNGNADVLVDAEYVITSTDRFIFGRDIESVTVSGRPAKYKNFHSLNDSVWCNRVFRANYRDNSKTSGGFFNMFK